MHIAIIPGDGIGKEVVPQALRVLRAAAAHFAVDLTTEDLPYGADHYLETGQTLPEEAFRRLQHDFDAILLGGLGDPRVPDSRHARDILLGLRFRLDLFINFRPIRCWREDMVPLRGKVASDLDFVVFRENTEGLYTGHGGRMKAGTPDEVATQTMVCTRRGVDRIIRAAFEWARENGRSKVCMADKANALSYVGAVWRESFRTIASEFPEIVTREEYIDALCMHLIRCPEEFDVIVTGNLFGDIVTDMGAALQGGLGMAISANLHPGRMGLFEPVHGTAPDIAGQGLANPFATILTGALMLDINGASEAARAIETAVQDALGSGDTTGDIGGHLSTTQATDAVLRNLEKKLR
jgi:3-isopropylmalate dehydrogenase